MRMKAVPVILLLLQVSLLAAGCGWWDPSPTPVGTDAEQPSLPSNSQTRSMNAPTPAPTPAPEPKVVYGMRTPKPWVEPQQREWTPRYSSHPPLTSEEPQLGLITIDELILTSDVIARVRLRSISASSRWYDPYDGKVYVPYANLTFDVLETLQGSPGNTVVVQLSVGDFFTHRTASDAERSSTTWIATERVTQWDGHDAIVFLWSVSKSELSLPGGRPNEVQYVFAGDGRADFGEDLYSIHSERNKAWLPAVASSSSTVPQSSDGNQLFYLDDPSGRTTDQTLSLTGMKTRITATNALVNETIPGHKKCLIAKYRLERDPLPKLPEFWNEGDHYMESGQPAGSAVVTYIDQNSGGYKVYIVEGPDGDLFEGQTTDDDMDAENGYERTLKQRRPLPKGQYVYHHGTQRPEMVPCDYIPPYRTQWTVHVTSPAGTLHEFFFDPVTVDTTVAADGTNGVFKPAAFTDANGGSVTIESISYEASTVKVEVKPNAALAGHIVDIIELDGTVSLSLDVADATVDDANDTLSWSVSSEPWEDGDKLMVRIREAR